jgi:hypothetical protein
MARLRKNETSVNMPPAAPAPPARRKTAAAPRTRKASKPEARSKETETEELVAAVTEKLAEPAVELDTAPQVIVTAETALIEYLPSREEIAALAYTYWVERGYADGDREQDWLRAETELRQRAVAASA